MSFERTSRGVALVAAALLIAAVGPGTALAAKKKAKTPPPPYFAVNPGEKLIYLVPGYVNDISPNDTAAAAVHCLNVGFPDNVDVRVEGWSDGAASPSSQATQTVSPGENATWASQSVLYLNPLTLQPNVEIIGGSLRIIQLGPGKVICRALEILNPENTDTNAQSVRDLPVIPFGGEASAGGKKKK